MNEMEDYIWGRIDEADYLRNIVANDLIDEEQLLPKLNAIQQNLNIQLRQGVEENYPRLLEQVSAIEVLDNMQAQFDKEMHMVSHKAQQMGNIFADYSKQLRADIMAIRNLTKMNRFLSDAIRCEELIKQYQSETDLILQSELVNELLLITSENDKLKQLNWFNERLLFKINELGVKTRADVLKQLKSALKTLNASLVSGYMKSLLLIMDPQTAQCQINAIINDAVKELDSLLLQWSTQATFNDKSLKILPQLGNRLHSFLEQFQLLGSENVEFFARQMGKQIASRVLPSTPNVIRFVQTIYKCLVTHNDGVIKIIRDAMDPLKTAILSESLSTLFSLVDDAFAQDEKKGPLIVEKLNLAMKSELQSVNFDLELQKEMEGNILKTLKYISVKIEQQIQFNDDTLRLIGRVSKAQLANYQMLCVAFEFTRQWPQLAHSITSTIIEPSICALMDRMKSTINLVLESMHSTEDLHSPLVGNASSSLYMKELCDHLKVFRTHIQQIHTILEYQSEKLPNFLDYILSHFLQHISLIRPLIINRCAKDFDYLSRVGIAPFNCKTAKLFNPQITDLLKNLPKSLDEFSLNETDSTIPDWLYVNLMINASGNDIHMPHLSAGWSPAQFIEWFDKNATKLDLWQFYNNLLHSYQQSVVSKNATEFVKYYPILMKIVQRNMKST